MSGAWARGDAEARGEGPFMLRGRMHPAARRPRSAFGALLIATVPLLAWPWVFGLSPLVSGGSARTGFILLAPVAIVLLLFFQVRTKLFIARSSLAYLALFSGFALVYVLAVLRADTVVLAEETARLGLAVTIVLVGVFAVLVFNSLTRGGTVKSLFDAFALALPVYVAGNFILYLVFGPEWLQEGKKVYFPQMSGLAALIGIQSPRLSSLGLVNGSNVIGVQAGASIVLLGSLLMWRKEFRLRLAVLPLLAANVLVLALVETRIVLATAPLALLAFRFANRRTLLFMARCAVAAATVSPLVMSYLFWSLSSTSLASALVRQGQDGEALGVGTGRAFMLDAGVSEIGISNVLGWGFYGHESSGVIGAFQWIFQSPERSSLHNTTLQNLYDIGLVGAALYVALLLASFRILARTSLLPEQPAKALMALLLFIVLISFTEVAGTLYHFNLFILQALLFGFVFAASEAGRESGIRKRRTRRPAPRAHAPARRVPPPRSLTPRPRS